MTETFRPFPYQVPMVEHLLANDRAALFVSPGKGKTVVTGSVDQTVKVWNCR